MESIRHNKKIIISVLLLFIFTSLGCIQQADITPDSTEYVFNYTPYNSIAYYIMEDGVKTVYVIHNATQLDLIYMTSASSRSNFGMSNIVAVNRGNTANSYSYTISSRVIKGRKHVFIEFPPSTDFVAYTEKLEGNALAREIKGNNQIKVVLLPDYTTGSRFLGMPIPKPDKMYEDDSGRTIMEWNGSDIKGFSVKYYKRSAPITLTYFFTILAVAAMLVLTYYRLKMQVLRKRREGR
ncbi:MAG: hypothetical protein DIAAKJNI_00355 [Candidatus Argoarchaeum ethanivorans]|uniref:Uncharacterized protein n=1 Tax=Candidatus Argoarchaeum ethanivorans TaxID=2608793 RepID=A0A811TD41_9EURY|nr:MAG: hypothetical protein DIAAKJNI_00355 [Candidatus Argoarchaeum ethanivorans]